MSFRVLAETDAWRIRDVICTSGPQDRAFPEQSGRFSIAAVAAGSFQYSARGQRHFMAPGSIMLVSAGEPFRCAHDHAAGDRCVSITFERDYVASFGARRFAALRLPPSRSLAAAVARACALDVNSAWEEMAVGMLGACLETANGPAEPAAASAEARVARTVRMIDNEPLADVSLTALAREARLSAWHFLRSFQQVTGIAPHQYVLRTRLRNAAVRLLEEPRARVLDIALDAGFGDVSNFNRAFRNEFGVTPRKWRWALETGLTISTPGVPRATIRRG